MILMEPHEPLTPLLTSQLPPTPRPPDPLSALADIPMAFWHSFNEATGLPHWLLPVALGLFIALRIGPWIVRDEWWTTDPEDTSHVLLSDLRKDSDAVHDPRSDRWWRCRYCGVRGSFYGTVQEEAEAAHEHEATCRARPVGSAVRRCPECAAPIDPVDDLLRGLFDDEDEPGPTGWKPGMPPWGTPPLLPLQNQARAELFRQMMSDALRRSKGGPV